MNGIPHHLIDEIDPDEEWNVTLFQKSKTTYRTNIS